MSSAASFLARRAQARGADEANRKRGRDGPEETKADLGGDSSGDEGGPVDPGEIFVLQNRDDSGDEGDSGDDFVRVSDVKVSEGQRRREATTDAKFDLGADEALGLHGAKARTRRKGGLAAGASTGPPPLVEEATTSTLQSTQPLEADADGRYRLGGVAPRAYIASKLLGAAVSIADAQQRETMSVSAPKLKTKGKRNDQRNAPAAGTALFGDEAGPTDSTTAPALRPIDEEEDDDITKTSNLHHDTSDRRLLDRFAKLKERTAQPGSGASDHAAAEPQLFTLSSEQGAVPPTEISVASFLGSGDTGDQQAQSQKKVGGLRRRIGAERGEAAPLDTDGKNQTTRVVSLSAGDAEDEALTHEFVAVDGAIQTVAERSGTGRGSASGVLALLASGDLRASATMGQQNSEDVYGRANDSTLKNTASEIEAGVALVFRDDKGRLLTKQQAFRHQSRIFHGRDAKDTKLQKK